MLICDQVRDFIIREATRFTKPVDTVAAATDKGAPALAPASLDEKTAVEVQAGSSESSSEVPSQGVAAVAGPVAAVRLRKLHAAYEGQVLYIVGKEQMRISADASIWRRVVLNAFLWLRDNTRSKIAAMKIPTDQLVEVGFIKEV